MCVQLMMPFLISTERPLHVCSILARQPLDSRRVRLPFPLVFGLPSVAFACRVLISRQHRPFFFFRRSLDFFSRLGSSLLLTSLLVLLPPISFILSSSSRRVRCVICSNYCILDNSILPPSRDGTGLETSPPPYL